METLADSSIANTSYNTYLVKHDQSAPDFGWVCIAISLCVCLFFPLIQIVNKRSFDRTELPLNAFIFQRGLTVLEW